jgi:hypothetical protein
MKALAAACFLSAMMTVHLYLTGSLDFSGSFMSIQKAQKDFPFTRGEGNRLKLLSL